MKNSPLRESHREYRIDGEIQDPYNIRCAAQIPGSCAELIDECEETLLREINSVTDNPVILPLLAGNPELALDPSLVEERLRDARCEPRRFQSREQATNSKPEGNFVSTPGGQVVDAG